MVSGCKRALKAFERIQCTRETTLTISRVIPSVWNTRQTHGPQDPNQSNQISQAKTASKESSFSARCIAQ